ncbi:MAG: nitrous oxide-stimulated promoter family protein [Syntrophotaleaceae bacterium]
MANENRNISRRTRRDIRTLKILTEIYCRDHHRSSPDHSEPSGLCRECEKFLAYGENRLLRCPLKPKPACRDCHIHCFSPSMRDTARNIMRYGWPRIFRRGRIDLLWRLLMSHGKGRHKKSVY